ncbi:signaling protein [Gracilibacillus halophilus YIM-C55.5]|uniref:Signaling protein n=1 Tax=Gracilibacillus halophilus YIM-C55.5 TaxID=1308866 RepID=N4WXU5_9BACI|nr:PAS domain S-box protein [Gracilibacillus halophilus]ENH97896.1 signaling protein [Gracilibacillus halophilus YIM-C55.5]
MANNENIYLQILKENMTDQIYIMQAQKQGFVYYFLNRQAMNETGLTEKVIGLTLHDALPKEKAAFLHDQYLHVLESQEQIEYVDEFQSDSGERYMKSKLFPINDQEKSLTFVVAVVQDITDQEKTQSQMEQIWNELDRSKKNYQSLFSDNPDAILAFDLHGEIVNSNPQTEQLIGYRPTELIGKTAEHIFFYDKEINKLFNQNKHQQVRTRVYHKQGHSVDVAIKVTPLIIDQAVEGIFAIIRNLSQEHQSQQKLLESEERFRIIAENAHDLISLVDRNGKIIYASPSYRKIVGFHDQEFFGKVFLHQIHPDDQDTLYELVTGSIQNGEPYSAQVRHNTESGQYIWIESYGTPVFDVIGNFKYMVVLSRDVTLQRRYEEQLEHFAMHDSLSDLPNRRLFQEKLRYALEQFQRNEEAIAVIMLDIDDFKSINDEYGHDIGDEVIVEFGQRIQQIISRDDIVARLGGDEFIVLLRRAQGQFDVKRFAREIKQKIYQPWPLHGNQLHVTTSIGIRILQPNDSLDATQLMKQADIALYQAKKGGKDGYYVFDHF